MSETICPKCGGPMTAGSLKDDGRRWAAESGAVAEVLHQAMARATADVDARHGRVVTFACKHCGYLESYLGEKL